MRKQLRVYGWQSARVGHGGAVNPGQPWNNQTREICAATSMAEVARIAGARRPSDLFNLCETGNAGEIEAAMAKPRRVLWRGLDERRGFVWREDP